MTATNDTTSASAKPGAAPDTAQDRPDVTIIVIAYNEEKRIGRCLKHLTDQDYQGSYQIVVVNDGSSDRTSDIAKTYPVQLLELPANQGRGAARAAGVAAAQSDLIGFVDADIAVGTDWIRRLVNALSDADGVSGVAVPDGDIAPLVRITGATPRPTPASRPITGNNVIFRADVLARHPFDTTSRLGEDFRLATEMQRNGVRLRTLPDVLVHHDEHKTYRKSFAWLYQSGKDADLLWATYRETRTPDRAFLAWLAAWTVTLVTVTLTVTLRAVAPKALRSGPVRRILLTGLGAGPLAGIGISALHAGTRLKARPRFANYLRAQIGNIPLMHAYLAGRLIGLLRRTRR